MTGTSHATALVVGCCAVIRSGLRRSLNETLKTSAMVKALVNGTYSVKAPSGRQGFGRVDLAKSLRCLPSHPLQCGGVFPMDGNVAAVMAQGETKTIKLQLRPPETTGTAPAVLQPKLTATMCYIDAPASELDSSLANQLTMPVHAGTPATARYGNTGTAIPDTLNNVQKVV